MDDYSAMSGSLSEYRGCKTASSDDTGVARKVNGNHGASNGEHDEDDDDGNAQFPLLRLPPEVRRIIWRHLLGNRLLHVHANIRSYPHIDSVRMRVCLQDYTPQQIYEKWTMAGPPTDDNNVVRYGLWNGDREAVHGHKTCHMIYHCCNGAIEPDNPFMAETVSFQHSLSILRTCRVIYHEATAVLWSTNTFAFVGQQYLSLFLKFITPVQASLLRSMHLSVRVGPMASELVRWADSFVARDLARLTNLKELHVYMNETQIDRSDENRGLAMDSATEWIEVFRAFALTKVTVVVDSVRPFKWLPFHEPLDYEQDREWAEAMRRELLAPKPVNGCRTNGSRRDL